MYSNSVSFHPNADLCCVHWMGLCYLVCTWFRHQVALPCSIDLRLTYYCGAMDVPCWVPRYCQRRHDRRWAKCVTFRCQDCKTEYSRVRRCKTLADAEACKVTRILCKKRILHRTQKGRFCKEMSSAILHEGVLYTVISSNEDSD